MARTTVSGAARSRCKLTAKAVAVLRYLVAHPGRLVRKPALLEAVWPDVIVSDWALTTCIHEIRYVLGDVAKTPRYIATVHRQGYRFIAPVTVADAPPPLSVPEVLPRSPLSASPEPEAPQSSPTAAAPEEEHKLVTILCGALAEAPAQAARLGPEVVSPAPDGGGTGPGGAAPLCGHPHPRDE